MSITTDTKWSGAKTFFAGLPAHTGSGPFGTVLHGRGIPIDQSFDAVNLSNPALVAEIHRSYIDAGSDLIETNTFGANHYKLAEYGMQGQVEAVNQAAVAVARRVISGSFKDILLAGSVGPLGVRLAPLGRVTFAEAVEAFTEQIHALLTAEPEGVDLIIIETMSDIKVSYLALWLGFWRVWGSV